jgi:hypothetical protein
VIGGMIDDGATHRVELISLHGNPIPKRFQNLNDFPTKIYDGGGVFFPSEAGATNRVPHVCGGKNFSGGSIPTSYRYLIQTDNWLDLQSKWHQEKENEEFFFQKATGRLYITGGDIDIHRLFPNTTYTKDGKHITYLEGMPDGMSRHCMAVLDNGDIFVAGRMKNWKDWAGKKSSFLYKNESGKWEKCPDMIRERAFATCGVVWSKDGKEEIVVAGGKNSVVQNSSLDYVDESRWRQAKPLPIPIPTAPKSENNNPATSGWRCHRRTAAGDRVSATSPFSA